MSVKNDKLNILIFSILFFVLTLTQFLVFHSYTSIVSWLYVLITLVLAIFINFNTNKKNHRRVLIALIAYHIIYSILIVINFIDYPIAFNNTSQIIFTIGINLLWLVLYIYVMYHKNNEDFAFVFYIVTIVLLLFKSFSNSTRLISVVRGYMSNPLTIFGGVMIVLLTVSLNLSQLALLFQYLHKVNEECDLKIEG